MPIPTKAAVLGAALVAFAAPALVPVPAPAEAMRLAQAEDAPGYDAEQVESFAMALVEVRRIGEEARPEFEAAETESDRTEIRQTATERMVAAVRAEGLDIETYNSIAEAANENPELAARIGAELEDISAE
ncbi:MAG TPA: DUF4168 domain-containing protein [Paracoccaceae bacterium]|nr:DUF4168 domain-containing protein [Paracoccaceae bacterium]